MSMNMRTAAVVVTFNRKNKLKNVLSALEKQSVTPSDIIIIDNASTDGTDAFLKDYSQSFPLEGSVNLQVIRMDSNIGGAGGFARGIREAYSCGADYIWIFDDDGYPEKDALAKLLEGYHTATEEIGPNVPFACSLVKYIDGSICEMNNPVPTWDWARLLAKGQNSVMVTSCSFVSVLLPRWTIESYGLPYKEYFIWFDDAEYTMRLSAACPGIQVLDSIVIHDMGSNKGVNFEMINDGNKWKFAYGIRNQASFRLHHKGFSSYLLFCLSVAKQMKRGNVSRSIRLEMVKQMFAAVKFDPQIEYPNED